MAATRYLLISMLNLALLKRCPAMVRRSRGIGVRGGEFGNFLCNAKRQKHPYLKRGPEAPWYVDGRPRRNGGSPERCHRGFLRKGLESAHERNLSAHSKLGY